MFKKLLFLLNANELKKLCFLLIMILIMALLEMIGVASVLPFMAILANPDIVETNNILKTILYKKKEIECLKDGKRKIFF